MTNLTPALEGALYMARRGFKVHPVWGIALIEVDDGEGGIRATTDCACPIDSDSRNADGTCRNAAKHPIMRPWGSSTEEPVIRAWAEEFPGCNFGVRLAGHTVLDVDPRNGGEATYKDLEAGLRPTLTVASGGGGKHEFYLGEMTGKLGPGIDVKSGEGQQVVCAGSEHLSGARYALKDDLPVAPVPLRVTQAIQVKRADVPEWTGERVRENRNDYLVARFARERNNHFVEGVYLATCQGIANEEIDNYDGEYTPERVDQLARHRWDNHDGSTDPRNDALATAGLASPPVARTRMIDRIYEPSRLVELKPPPWAIEGIMPEAPIAVLYGHGGTHKSFIAMDWHLCMATGQPWFGRAVKPAKTLYVAAEGVSGLGKRIQAWCDARGVTSQDVARHLVYPAPVNLLDDEAVTELLDTVRILEVDRLVLDTVHRSIGGEEENNRTFGRLVASCDRLREATGVLVTMVHHTPQADPGRMRGGTALYDNIDASFCCENRKGELVTKLTSDKVKDAAGFDPLTLTFEVVPVTVGGEATTSLVAAHVDTVNVLPPEVLDEAGDRKVIDALLVLGDGGHGTKAIQEVMVGARTNARPRLVQDAIERRRVEVRPGGKLHLNEADPIVQEQRFAREAYPTP